MAKRQAELFAAIHLGSEQVSIQIAEFLNSSDIRIVSSATKQVALGEETFKTGRISFQSVNEVCELLKGFKRMLAEYGVHDYQLVATTAIREALNQHYIIDQIEIKTGFSVGVVDIQQEVFYKYCSLFCNIQKSRLLQKAEGLLFVDISSGALSFILYSNGKLKYQQNIHIGVLRIKEIFEREQRESSKFHQALGEFIYSAIHPVASELKGYKIDYLVLSGLETTLVLRMLDKRSSANVVLVTTEELNSLYEKVKSLNLPQLMKTYNLSEATAEFVLPTIVLYKQVLDLADVSGVVIALDRFIDGLTLLQAARKAQESWLSDIDGQVISLADSLGNRYQNNCAHAAQVARFSLLFFDRLWRIHGMGYRERQLLNVAAILHDIGKFVNLRKHYFYSYRLIISSDLFGFSEEEKQIIANIAYYHSKETPSEKDANFSVLSREQKVKVAKLAAIIRLADALDRSHCQKVVDCKIKVKGEEMTVAINYTQDVVLEEWTFRDKAAFFEEVFGIKAMLERQDHR